MRIWNRAVVILWRLEVFLNTFVKFLQNLAEHHYILTGQRLVNLHVNLSEKSNRVEHKKLKWTHTFTEYVEKFAVYAVILRPRM